MASQRSAAQRAAGASQTPGLRTPRAGSMRHPPGSSRTVAQSLAAAAAPSVGPGLPEGCGLRVLSRPAGWCHLSWLDGPEPGRAAVTGERCRTWQRPSSAGVGALCSAQCRRHPGRGAEASGQSALLTWFTGVCGDQVPRRQGLPLEGVWVWRPSAE